MSLPVRIALVVVGLAAVVYGAANLSGGWLGTPPWWERRAYNPSMLPPYHVASASAGVGALKVREAEWARSEPSKESPQ